MEIPLIEIRKLVRHHKMGKNVVRAMDGADLRVNKGDFLVVAGASGSGKSTLMHLIGMLDEPTSGSIMINGREMSQTGDRILSRLRNRRIGMVFQQFNLIGGLTVLDNIALPLAYGGVPLKERRERAAVYAKRLGLGDRLHHLPTELSGGQMQRVAIARALINDPDILLADEPTGNLDSAAGANILNLLHELNSRSHTIIMVSHDPNAASKGTRKITIEDGKIIYDSPRDRAEVSRAKEHEEQLTEGNELSGRLGFYDLIRIGVREGLMTHGMRTFLTMLGIIIGVFAVIAMSSFSLGGKKKQADQIRALGANLVRIADAGLENEPLVGARTRGSHGLSIEDLRTIMANITEIRKSAAIRQIKLNTLYEHKRLSPRILGVKGDYLSLNNLKLKAGRYFDSADFAGSSKSAVIGHKIARELGKDDPTGEILMMGGVFYTIIGVLESKHIEFKELEATTISDPNYDVLIPLSTLLARTTFLDLRSEIDEIQLQLASEDDLYRVGRDIKRILAITHNGVDDYEIVIPMDLLKQKQQSGRLLNILTFCISTIAIIVGGIGIMNIMLASVTERIREIGIRRSIGASKRDILYQFLSESVLISITGGILGVILALLVVLATCRVVDLPIVFSIPLIIAAFFASTAAGLVFGIYPAWMAANMNPVKALRYE